MTKNWIPHGKSENRKSEKMQSKALLPSWHMNCHSDKKRMRTTGSILILRSRQVYFFPFRICSVYQKNSIISSNSRRAIEAASWYWKGHRVYTHTCRLGHFHRMGTIWQPLEWQHTNSFLSLLWKKWNIFPLSTGELSQSFQCCSDTQQGASSNAYLLPLLWKKAARAWSHLTKMGKVLRYMPSLCCGSTTSRY